MLLPADYRFSDCEVLFRVYTMSYGYRYAPDTQLDAEPQCTQLLKLLALLQGTGPRRDKLPQHVTPISVCSVMSQSSCPELRYRFVIPTIRNRGTTEIERIIVDIRNHLGDMWIVIIGNLIESA